MTRLPIPGGDNGNWGAILNDYLSRTHKSDGSLKENIVTSETIAPAAVTTTALAPNSVTPDVIAPAAITADAIAPAAVTVEALALNTINDTVIADGSITNPLIADNTIEEAKLSVSVQSKLNQTAPVTSVATKTGDVTLDKTDVGLDQVDNTSDATKNSATVTLTNKTLTTPAIDSIKDANGNTILDLSPVASAVNYVQIINSTGGVGVKAVGSSSNINLNLYSKGTGQIIFRDENSGAIAYVSPASGIIANYFVITPATAGNAPTFSVGGSDTNVSLNLVTQGTGTVQANSVPVITTTGTQTLTNKTISGSSNTISNIANASLTNSSLTIGSTPVSLGSTATTIAGLTLTTPTIASFTNATHNHSNATGGGTISYTDLTSRPTLPSGSIVGTTDAQTLTNKTITSSRITKRVGTTTSSATPTINTDNYDVYGLTAQAVDITSFTANLSGTPTDSQSLLIYVVGTATRAITWGASFENGPVTLPTATTGTQRLDVSFMWNSATSKWRCMAAGSA